MSCQEVRPQSIIHHIGRLGSKIVKPISMQRQRIRMRRRKLQEGSVISRSSHQPVTISESDTSSILAGSVSITSSVTCEHACSPVSDDDASSQGDYHSLDSDDLFSLEDELFETIDQNEFLLECFLTNGQSDVLFLVHFFNQETSISDAVEDILSIRVLETNSKCECRRINSKSAPLFTAKLQIDPEQPTVVAIKNGKVLSKVSDISSSTCTEVKHWLTRTRLLESDVSIHTFSGLSTTI